MPPRLRALVPLLALLSAVVVCGHAWGASGNALPPQICAAVGQAALEITRGRDQGVQLTQALEAYSAEPEPGEAQEAVRLLEILMQRVIMTIYDPQMRALTPTHIREVAELMCVEWFARQ